MKNNIRQHDSTTSVMEINCKNKIVEVIFDSEDLPKLAQFNTKWHLNSRGYPATKKCKKNIMLHRVINGTPENLVTDHINGNKLDVRKINLRTTTQIVNLGNIKKTGNNYIGVRQTKNAARWYITLNYNNKKYYDGMYGNAEDAARAYNILSKALRGLHCTINNVKDPFKVPAKLETGLLNTHYRKKTPTFVVLNVGYKNRPWRAYYYYHKQYTSLGYYATKEEADLVLVKAKNKWASDLTNK